MTPQQQHFEMRKQELSELRSMIQDFELGAKNRRLPRSRRPEDLIDFDAENRSLADDIEYLESYMREHEALDGVSNP